MPVKQSLQSRGTLAFRRIWVLLREHQASLVVAGSFLAAGIRLYFAYSRATTPFQLEYEEGNILNAGFRLLHGQTPYPPAGSFPYVFNPYGPVAYFLAALALKFGGLSLLGPRLLILISGLGSSILVALVARLYQARTDIAILLGLFFLCSPVMWEWFPLLRVDLWAVSLTLLGFYIFARNQRQWPVAAVLFALAILTKHTAVAAPAACVLEMLVAKNWRKSIAFCLLIGLISAATVWLSALNGVPWFHLLKTHPDDFNLIRWAVAYSIAAGWACLVAGIVLYARAFGFRSNPQTRLLWIYFLCCNLTVISAGKLGSNLNHFLEWTAVLCVLGALALHHLLQTGEALACAWLVALFLFSVCLSFAPQAELAHSGEKSECRKAYAWLQSSPAQRVLSEDVSAVLLSGKPVLVSNPFVTTQLGNSVRWENGKIEDLINKKYFDLIVLGDDPHAKGRWSPADREAINRHYAPAQRFECSPYMALAYVPR